MRLARLASLLLSLAPCLAQTGFQEPGEVFVSPPVHHGEPAHHGEAGGATRAAPPSSPLGGSQPVPEPSSLLLVGTGLVGVALTARWSRWRRRRQSIDRG